MSAGNEAADADAGCAGALIILNSLCAFLMSQGYVVGNPFASVALPSNPQHPLGSSRSLTRVGGKRSTPLSRNAPA